MKKIYLKGKHSSKFAIIDDMDLAVINKYNWYFVNGYAMTNIKKIGKWKTVRMHKLLTGFKSIDHINNNGLDNRRNNLRVATQEQNQANRRKFVYKNREQTSIFKGVSIHTGRKLFRSCIGFNKKRISIGFFKSEIHAAMAYDIWAKELHSEYANFNFPSAGPKQGC